MPRLSQIYEIIGPTPVNGVRNVEAKKIIAIINNIVEKVICSFFCWFVDL